MLNRLSLLFLMLGCIACSKLQPVEKPSVVDDFAMEIGTKSTAPLVNTIWECEVDGEYNLYLWFWSDTRASVFYGKEDDGLQRWSAFYGGEDTVICSMEMETGVRDCGGVDYSLCGDVIDINLTYPLFGNKESLTSVSMGHIDKDYRLVFENGKTFTYYGCGNADLATGIWMTISTEIVPWMQKN